MKFLLLLTFCLFPDPPDYSHIVKPGNFNSYCNSRFRYCIDYPSFLIAQPESENGDGRVFTDKTGQKVLTVFGRLNQDSEGNPIPLQKQFEKDSQDLLSSGIVISYKKLGRNFYVLSGSKGETIVYRKTILREDAFCFAYLEYDISQKILYDSIVSRISQSFK